MKAQRRHDLQTNTLVESLEDTVEQIKTHGQKILLVILAVIVVVVAGWWYRQSAAAQRAQGWSSMMNLVTTTIEQDPGYLDKLEQVAVDHSDLRAMAYAQLGNELLRHAQSGKLDAAKTAEYRKRAQDAFNNSLSAADNQPVARAIAHLGLGAVAADSGDSDTARKQYEAVQADAALKGLPYPSQAASRLAALDAAAKLPPLATGPVAVESPASQAVATQPAQG